MTLARPLAFLFRTCCLPGLAAFSIGCTTPAVSDSALKLAQQRVAAKNGTLPKEGSLVVVDYTKPSSEQRLTVVDLKTGRAKMNSRVAHGVNSGVLYATDFSDTVGSEKSSLGLYRVAETFNGKHGRSYRLDGLDPGLNLNARRRGIIVHSASYVSRETMEANRHEGFRLGRSQGCLALSEADLAKLDKTLKQPAYVFAYAPVLAPLPAAPAPAVTPEAPAPAVEAPQPMLVSADLPAIPRPAAVQTGPVGDEAGSALPAATMAVSSMIR